MAKNSKSKTKGEKEMTQTVTTESWGSRLGGSIKGVFTGVIMVIIAIVLLFWNEGRAVKRAKALAEGKSSVISIDANSIDANNEGKLVHATADLVTPDYLQDTAFGINENAIELERIVEIYQWVESSTSKTEKKLGGSTETVTTYSYSAKWLNEPVNSNEFKDEKARIQYVNVGGLPFRKETQYATNVTFGAFRFNDDLIKRISGSEDYKFAADAKLPLPVARIEGKYVIIPAATALPQTGVVAQQQQQNAAVNTAANVVAAVNAVQTQNAQNQAAAQPAQNQAAAQPAQNQAVTAVANQAAAVATSAVNGQLNPAALPPQIGDVRVSFRIIRPHKVSIAAAQKGDTFTSFVASNDETVFLMENGEKSAAQMFTSAEKGNAMWTWILRIIGFLLMKAGFGAIFRPLSVLADVVPFIGNVVGAGTGIISSLIALPLSLVVIAIAWLFYRPLIAIILLAVVIGSIVLLVTKLKGAKKAPAPAAA